MSTHGKVIISARTMRSPEDTSQTMMCPSAPAESSVLPSLRSRRHRTPPARAPDRDRDKPQAQRGP